MTAVFLVGAAVVGAGSVAAVLGAVYSALLGSDATAATVCSGRSFRWCLAERLQRGHRPVRAVAGRDASGADLLADAVGHVARGVLTLAYARLATSAPFPHAERPGGPTLGPILPPHRPGPDQLRLLR